MLVNWFELSCEFLELLTCLFYLVLIVDILIYLQLRAELRILNEIKCYCKGLMEDNSPLSVSCPSGPRRCPVSGTDSGHGRCFCTPPCSPSPSSSLLRPACSDSNARAHLKRRLFIRHKQKSTRTDRRHLSRVFGLNQSPHSFTFQLYHFQ